MGEKIRNINRYIACIEANRELLLIAAYLRSFERSKGGEWYLDVSDRDNLDNIQDILVALIYKYRVRAVGELQEGTK